MSFEQKQACYDKVRRSNYLASPHIEGFDTHRTDADKPLPSHKSALEKHRENKD
ncbi:YhfG family protein [Pseudomonas sp. R4-76]|uniref:YhfG family protein n=1 Tax=unclassified Pseudomonas TaxID=196821 RepID=UPI003DA83560